MNQNALSAILQDGCELIDVILSDIENLSVSEFIRIHESDFFRSIQPITSLLAPECKTNISIATETAYVFLVGSYLYFRLTGKPVTWFERRRFAVFQSQSEPFFRRTLCTHIPNRFQTLEELKDCLQNQIDLIQDAYDDVSF